MFCKTLQICLLLAFWVTNVVAASQDNGTNIDGVTLLAYGHGINGFSVCAGPNGTAMISATPGVNDTIPITWNISTQSAEAWSVTPNYTNSDVSPGSKFYIITTSDSFSPAGFINENATAPSGAVTTGFLLYGSDVMYVSDDKYLSQFWATPTLNNTYELVWNTNGEVHDSAVPVDLKYLVPPTRKV